MSNARPKVLYLSHAGEDVYALIREVAGGDFDVVTLERDDDGERCSKIATCQAVICAASGLRKVHLDAGEGTAGRASPGRRLAGHDRLAGDQAARIADGSDAWQGPPSASPSTPSC